MKYDVFISYSRRDYIDENKQVIPENIISQIKKLFDENNISYWLDENGLSGQDFTHLIPSKIRESSLFLFVSSEHSNRSKWTSREIGVADKFKKTIIPFRYDESVYNDSVIMFIANLDYIDYFSNPKLGLSRLLKSVQAYLKEAQDIEKRRRDEEEHNRREEEIKKQLHSLEQRKIELANERFKLENRLNSLKNDINDIEKRIKELTYQLSVYTKTDYNNTSHNKNKFTTSDWIVIVLLSSSTFFGHVIALTLWIINSVRRSKGKDYLVNPRLPLYVGIGASIFIFFVSMSLYYGW